jgi:hypothetical protein
MYIHTVRYGHSTDYKPNRDDGKAGIIAYKIAAHAADLDKGFPVRRIVTMPFPRLVLTFAGMIRST